MLVAGEAGIGKTSLVRAAVANAAREGARVTWGTCLDVDGAPGYWPWTQAVDNLVRQLGRDAALAVAGDDASVLASMVPSLGTPSHSESSARDRLLLMDAVLRFLDGLAAIEPVVVVLDDLQWADESSLELFDFLTRVARPAPVGLVGVYRPGELAPPARARLGDLRRQAEHLELEGLDAAAVATLVQRLSGETLDPAAAAALHRRTGGHPFFVRELALFALAGAAEQVPVAVREAIDRRIARLPAETVEVLKVAALLGTALLPDVVAAALGWAPVDVEEAIGAAIDAGVLARRGDETVFAHDLLRETALARVDGRRRASLHRAIAVALEDRQRHGGNVAPSAVARHFTAAVGLDGPDRAVHWALRAAASDVAGLGFVEAAGHLRRLRGALADAAVPIDDDALVRVLVAEADAHVRAGDNVQARGLLRHAADIADRAGDPLRIAQVAVATAGVGSIMAERRDDVVRRLEHARTILQGVDDVWEARATATLARELHHSARELHQSEFDDRGRAEPLSEQALAAGRRPGDPPTLLACLLARHDVLWRPGTAAEREAIAREMVIVAADAGDEERHAQGLLLLANALVEQGSPTYAAHLDACLVMLEASGQPQHRYVAATRRACIALLRGDLDAAGRLIAEAAELGARIREPDAPHLTMSQRLELVRARAEPGELRAFAAEAVEHWTSEAVHAHAIAAGFMTKAGDLDAARRHVAVVLELGLRAHRSFLWAQAVRELAVAAIALGEEQLCKQLLDDVRPLVGTCGVNGAVVAFAGSHAHTAGLLAAALCDLESSKALLRQAAATYDLLGAEGWLAEVRGGHGPAPSPPAIPAPNVAASMHRQGPLWHVSFAGRQASVPHSKGLADIARLVAAPGADVNALELMRSLDRSYAAGDLADARALAAYRQRLADIDSDIDDAARDNDDERRARAEAEREALLEELRRITRTGGGTRAFANYPAERARKAVTGRIRETIRKLEPVLPELAAHLERTIVTGTYCRYRPEGTHWQVDVGER